MTYRKPRQTDRHNTYTAENNSTLATLRCVGGNKITQLTSRVVRCGQCVDMSSTYKQVLAGAATVQSVSSYDCRRCVWSDVVSLTCRHRGRRAGVDRSTASDGGRLVTLDVTAKRHEIRLGTTHQLQHNTTQYPRINTVLSRSDNNTKIRGSLEHQKH